MKFRLGGWDVGTLILIRPGNTTGLLVVALQSEPQGHSRRIHITILIIRVNLCFLQWLTSIIGNNVTKFARIYEFLTTPEPIPFTYFIIIISLVVCFTCVNWSWVVPGVVWTKSLSGELLVDPIVWVVPTTRVVRVRPTNQQPTIVRVGQHPNVVLAVILSKIRSTIEWNLHILVT